MPASTPSESFAFRVGRLLAQDAGEGAPEVAEPLHDDELEILRAFEDRVRRGGNNGVGGSVYHKDAPDES